MWTMDEFGIDKGYSRYYRENHRYPRRLMVATDGETG